MREIKKTKYYRVAKQKVSNNAKLSLKTLYIEMRSKAKTTFLKSPCLVAPNTCDLLQWIRSPLLKIMRFGALRPELLHLK